jgi:DNA-binding transcriptional regulator YiaG
MAELNENQQFIRDMVDEVQLPKQRLARLWGGSFAAVHGWLNAKRSPTPESLRLISAGLEEYGKMILALSKRAAELAKERTR